MRSHLDEISHSSSQSASAKKHQWQRTEIYRSGDSLYCRFRWGYGSKTNGYAHINGGSASTKVVQARRATVDRMIAEGRSLQDILDTIRQFPNEPAGRKKF